MEIYSIGFTRTSAEHFFGRLSEAGIERACDVRLNTGSQLAGFAKGRDLAYFLDRLVGATYRDEPLLVPTRNLFEAFKRRGEVDWAEFARRYLALIRRRRVETRLRRQDFERQRTVLICSEGSHEHCHRRLAIEYLDRQWGGVTAVHL